MAKVEMTTELAQCIKTLRIRHNIKANAISTELGKNASYITKLESGKIKTINEEDFFKIIKLIVGDDSSDLEAAFDELGNCFNIIYTDKELEDQLWFINFDTVYRRLPIPKSLIDEINDLMNSYNISENDLLKNINSNINLPESERTDPNIPYNIWYIPKDRTDGSNNIKINITNEELSDILNGKVSSTSYVFINAIVHYLYRIITNNFTTTDNDRHSIYKLSAELLAKHKFYSLQEKESRILSAKNNEELSNIFSEADKTYQETIDKIYNKIDFFSDVDIESTNIALKKICDNMDWDAAFILSIASLPFSKLENLNREQKESIFNEIKHLLQEHIANDKDYASTLYK